MREPLLEARGLVMSFARVRALRGADFTVFPSEVVALIGDNGAGKSTLIKCITGVLKPDAGELFFDGEPVDIHHITDARDLGIETVYQDLALAPDLDSAANLFLGREELRGGVLGRLGFLDNSKMRERTADAFATLGVGVQDPAASVATLSGGQRQGVAVARAVTWARKVVIMDEPTAALGVVQTRKVLDLICRVRDQGTAVVLVSHNIPEVIEVADRVEVLRLGQRVARFTRGSFTMEDLVGAMTGALRQDSA